MEYRKILCSCPDCNKHSPASLSLSYGLGFCVSTKHLEEGQASYVWIDLDNNGLMNLIHNAKCVLQQRIAEEVK